MKQLSTKQKKWLKSIHLLAAGIWITTGLIMFFIHLFNNDIKTGEQLYLLNKIIYQIDMRILVPAAITCLLTGWIYSHFTKWGYFEHGWLIFKWIITVLIIVLGTFFSGPWNLKLVEISERLGIKALSDADYQWFNQSHSIMGTSMTITLIVTIFISVFKPARVKGNGSNINNKQGI